MTERNIGLRERLTPESKSKIEAFAAAEQFSGMPQDLKVAAIKHATFFVDASDATVNLRLKALYENGKNASFNHREKQSFGSLEEVNARYIDLFHQKIEEDGLSPEEANRFAKKQKRIEVATREARNEFAKILNYVPGLEGLPGRNDYKATIANPEFQSADTLVREAVEKFS